MDADEIKIWILDGSGGATPLPRAQRTASERLLEDTLVYHPELLWEGLTLVGRQTPTEGGPLDLLGIDEDGRLVVFELKRGTLSRDAVAQVIDYASFIDSMSDQELTSYISVLSGFHGIERIEDFGKWYDAKSQGLGLDSLRPVRMVLVGLGADERTTRMVRFMAKEGMDISLVTFDAFNIEGVTLLSRRVSVEPSTQPTSDASVRVAKENDLMNVLLERVSAREDTWPGIRGIWDAAQVMFMEEFKGPRLLVDRRRGLIAHGRRAKSRPNRLNFQILRRHHSAAAIEIDDQEKEFRIIFFGGYVDLYKEGFERAATEWKSSNLVLDTWDPHRSANGYGPNGPVEFPREKDDPAQYCPELKFGLSTMEEWEKHREMFADLARNIYGRAEDTPQSDMYKGPQK